MPFDIRTYTCRPGTIGKHLELSREKGLVPQKRHLGEPLFYGTCETGDPNQYVHIRVYENAGDREAKRAAMWGGPGVAGLRRGERRCRLARRAGEQADGERTVLRVERVAEMNTARTPARSARRTGRRPWTSR